MRSTGFVIVSIGVHLLAFMALAMTPTQTVNDQAGDKIEVQVDEPADKAGAPEAQASQEDSKPQVSEVKPEPVQQVKEEKPAEPVKEAKAEPAKPKPVAVPVKAKTHAKKAVAKKTVMKPVVAQQEDPAPKMDEGNADKAEAIDKEADSAPDPDEQEQPKFIPVKEGAPDGVEAATDDTQQEQKAEPPKEKTAPAAGAVAASSSEKTQTGQLTKGGATKEGAVSYLDLRQLPGNKPPEYPLRARLERRQGQLELVYRVTKQGNVSDIHVAKSSGYADFDDAAVQAIAKYRFVPGQEGWAKHPVNFVLKGPVATLPSTARTKLKQAAKTDDDDGED